MSKKEKTIMKTIEQVLQHLYSNKNPLSGSSLARPPAWVLFKHGSLMTAYDRLFEATKPTAQLLMESAVSAISQIPLTMVGGELGDFQTGYLKEWFPNDHVFYTLFPAIDQFSHVTILSDKPDMAGDEETINAMIGLKARASKDLDIKEKQVVSVGTFDGKIHYFNRS